MYLPKTKCKEEHKHSQRFSQVGWPGDWGWGMCSICSYKSGWLLCFWGSTALEDDLQASKQCSYCFFLKWEEQTTLKKTKGRIYFLQQEWMTCSCWLLLALPWDSDHCTSSKFIPKRYTRGWSPVSHGWNNDFSAEGRLAPRATSDFETYIPCSPEYEHGPPSPAMPGTTALISHLSQRASAGPSS